MINITFPETHVNQEYLSTRNVVLNNHSEGLRDVSLEHMIINNLRFTTIHSNLFNFLIEQLRKNKGHDKQILHSDFEKEVHRSSRTITRVISQLEEIEWITVDRVTVSINGIVRTNNTYNINWHVVFGDLGERIYSAASGYKFTFIQKQVERLKSQYTEIKDVITTAFETCRTSCLASTSSLSQRDKAYIDIGENSVFLEGLEDGSDEESGGLPPDDSEKDEIDLYNPRSYTYFPREYKKCPVHWIAISRSLGHWEESIEDDFQETREYWIGLGKIKSAKKANWDRVWINRVRSIVSRYNRNYSKKPENDFIGQISSNESYCWDIDFPIKDDWSECLKIHGISDTHLSSIYSQFSLFYTNKGREIRGCEPRWKERWINWLETTMRFESADRFLKPPRSNVGIIPPKQLPVNEVQEDRFRGIDDLPPHIQSKLSSIRSYMGDADFLSYIWSQEPMMMMFDGYMGIVYSDKKKWMRDRILRDTGHSNYFDSIGVKLL